MSPHIFKYALICLNLFWIKMCEVNYFWTHVLSRYSSLASEVRDSILGISHENFCPRNSSPVFFSVVRNISIERFPVRWITCRKGSVCFDCKFAKLTRTVLYRLPNIYFSCHCHTYWYLCCNYWPSVLNTVTPAIVRVSLARSVYNVTYSLVNAVSIVRIFA